jgi:flagellar basal-body rod protein FlgB
VPYSLYPKSMAVLQKALDLRAFRHKLIASNIANATTPGYQGKDISFEKQLTSSYQAGSAGLVRTNARHMPGLNTINSMNAEMIIPAQDSINNDLNSVDLDKELVKLSENNVLYNSLITVLKKQLDGIKFAIQEGGR